MKICGIQRAQKSEEKIYGFVIFRFKIIGAMTKIWSCRIFLKVTAAGDDARRTSAMQGEKKSLSSLTSRLAKKLYLSSLIFFLEDLTGVKLQIEDHEPAAAEALIV